MSRKLIIGLIIIIIFSAFALYTFQSTLSPYVSFAEAAARGGQAQVLANLVQKETIAYDRQTGALNFTVQDEEGTVTLVTYRGAKPNNFEHAESVVVIGSFKGDLFVAEKLLVKCPSKYEDQSEGEK
jgi:cytochrome c-type biogenesis protein CcmE